MRLAILTISFFLSQIPLVQGQNRFQFNHITVKDGLSSIYARKVIQDPFGNIWIGTIDGLNRYNGNSFYTYNKGLPNGKSITGSDIRDILLDTISATIWAVNSFGGLDQISYVTGNIISQYNQDNDSAIRGSLLCTLALWSGKLYAGGDAGLFVLDPSSRHLIRFELRDKESNSLTAGKVNKLLVDPEGKLWIFIEGRGIIVVNKNGIASTFKLHNLQGGGIRFFDACWLKDGTVLAATSSGAFIFKVDRNSNIESLPGRLPESIKGQTNIYACAEDKYGNLWISTSGLLQKIEKPSLTIINVKENQSRTDPEWLSSVYGIFFDNSGNLWLGCQQGLAYSTVQPPPFVRFTQSAVSDQKIAHAYYLFNKDDSILYACAQDGLYRVNIHTGIVTTRSAHKPFYHYFVDPFGREAESSIDGTFFSMNNTRRPLKTVYPEFAGFGDIVFNSHVNVGDSVLILGTENRMGIFIWNYRNHTAANVSDNTKGIKLKESFINTVVRFSDHEVWILGDQSISILDVLKNELKPLALQAGAGNKAFSIFFDVCKVNGSYYIASYGNGIILLDSALSFKRLITAHDGLTANTVYKILPWKDSFLFVTTNNGLSRIALKPSLAVTGYFQSDGLHSDVFEENSGTKAGKYIFAGGESGFTQIDPSLLTDLPHGSRCFFDRVKFTLPSGDVDTSNLLMENLEIPPTALQTTIYFSFPDFANPGRNYFAYRIKEIGSDWIKLGNQHFVTLLGLSPGSYNIQVSASRDGNSFGTITSRLTLRMLPKWFQTRSFKGLLLLFAIGVLYAISRYRINEIKNQQMIRREIAADLHDDIGSTLNAVKLFTQLAQKEPTKKEYLDNIEYSLTEVTQSLRDIIWVLDQSEDNLQQLMERIKKFAVPLFQASGVSCKFNLQEEHSSRKISKKEKRNLLLIAKESLNNCMKHAACTNVEIIIGAESGKTILTVKDNGKGFTISQASDGNGIRNIQYRAKQVGYRAQILTLATTGTTILVRKI